MHMIVTCPQCSTDFPVDPAKVPDSGVLARCSICPEVFRVDEQSLISTESEAFSGDEPSFAATDSDGLADPGVATGALESGEADSGVMDPIVDMEIPTDVNTNEFGERELTFDEVDVDEPDVVDIVVEVEGAPEPEELHEPEESPDAVDVVAPFETRGAPEIEAVEAPEPAVLPEPPPAVVEPLPTGGGSPFGRRSPADRAMSLARSLVSDMIAYHSEKHTLAIATGTLEKEFADEVAKSWKEYCDQVPREIIDSESFFNDALNDILAQGAQLFDHEG